MNEAEKERLDRLLAARPALTERASKSQIDSVREVLNKGWYIDFNWALKYCGKTQRLGAVIHILRHEEGMKIIDWQPTLYGGSVYSIYEYAPEEIRRVWHFLEKKTPEEIMQFDFAKGRRMVNSSTKGVMEGQISIFELF